MIYDPEKHKRRSIRLEGYDYAQEGLYFVTILCFQREHLFGRIEERKIMLNDGGRIASSCWKEIPKHFPQLSLHEYVIMPNHLHGILEIIPHEKSKGEKSFAPDTKSFRSPSKTIGSVVRGFKIGVTKWFRNHTDIHNVWHRNYHEHIIRDISDYHRISEYIRTNPEKWEEDCYWR